MKFHFKNIKDLLFIIGIKKKYLFFLISLFFIASIVDLISLSLVAPYITVIFNINDPSNYKFLNFFGLKDFNINNVVTLLSVLLIFSFFLKSVFSILIRWLIVRFAFKQYAILQVKLISAYQNMHYEDYILRNSSEYTRNVRELCEECVSSIESFLRVTSETIILLVVIIFLGFVNLKVLVFLFLVILPIFLVYE